MTNSRGRSNGEGSIYPYKNGYAAYAWITTPAGLRRRKYVYGSTWDEVHEKWIKLKDQAAKGPVVTKTPLFGVYLDYYLREIVRPNLAPKTIEDYERFARLYFAPGLGTRKLNMTTRDLQKWFNEVARTCQCCTQGKDASRPTKKQRCCAKNVCCEDYPSALHLHELKRRLRIIFNCAINDELIFRNVATTVKIPVARRKKRRRWTSEQARQFLASAKADNDPLYAAYVLVLVEGLRKGEVLGLPADAANFEYQLLDISWQLQRVGGKLLHRETKTVESDNPALPYPGIVGVALQERLAQRDRDKQAAAPVWEEYGLMFTTKLGSPIEPRNFNRAWEARIVKAGVPKISVHDGRRTCGSLLADLDVHPRVAMAILRHAQFGVTMEIYSEVSDEATRAGLKKLGDSLA
jgi:integrase